MLVLIEPTARMPRLARHRKRTCGQNCQRSYHLGSLLRNRTSFTHQRQLYPPRIHPWSFDLAGCRGVEPRPARFGAEPAPGAQPVALQSFPLSPFLFMHFLDGFAYCAIIDPFLFLNPSAIFKNIQYYHLILTRRFYGDSLIPRIRMSLMSSCHCHWSG